MKICSGCKVAKTAENFSKCSARKDGLHNYCKECAKENRHKRYLLKIVEEREQNRRWHLDNKPWKDPAKREHHNAWRRDSDRKPEVQKRRAKLLAGGSFTSEEWSQLCTTYGNKCLRCGKLETTIDHVIPISKGGSNTIDNLQPLCLDCNMWKGTQTIDYRMEAL